MCFFARSEFLSSLAMPSPSTRNGQRSEPIELHPLLWWRTGGRRYQVLTASDGLEALRLHPEAQEVDLLITDIVMPNLGGHELARRLRLAQPDLKILFTSGHTGDKIAPASDVQGTGFLQKPYRPDVLATKVRKMLDAKRSAA
jgi:CheY-like chemotaxis protein